MTGREAGSSKINITIILFIPCKIKKSGTSVNTNSCHTGHQTGGCNINVDKKHISVLCVESVYYHRRKPLGKQYNAGIKRKRAKAQKKRKKKQLKEKMAKSR